MKNVINSLSSNYWVFSEKKAQRSAARISVTVLKMNRDERLYQKICIAGLEGIYLLGMMPLNECLSTGANTTFYILKI